MLGKIYIFIYAFIYFALQYAALHCVSEEVGCFERESSLLLFSFSTHNMSVEFCVKLCLENQTAYATLYQGNSCSCSSEYSASLSDSCISKCIGNVSQICGGYNSVSVYETGYGILGPPVPVHLLGQSSDSILISWRSPENSVHFKVLEYKVSVIPVFTYSEEEQPRPLEWTFSPETKKTKLFGLHPGTRYKLHVQAVSKYGLGEPYIIETWTRVGVPPTPLIPEILSTTTTTMNIKLSPVIPRNGPITAYRVVVVDNTIPVVINYDSLTDYKSAKENNLPYYIAAELSSDEVNDVFTLGNSKSYGKYYNAPLKKGVDYNVVLGVVSKLNETEYSYSVLDQSQHIGTPVTFSASDSYNSYVVDNDVSGDGSNTPLILSLSVAIGVFGFLLIACLAFYAFIKATVRKSIQHSSENQELTVSTLSGTQDCETSYSVASHYLEEDPPVDYYKMLKEKVWIIPHQVLQIVGNIGVSKFGEIKKGMLLVNGTQQTMTLVHHIPDDSLNSIKKNQMLQEISVHIKVGCNPNVVSFIGLLEEINYISLVFEYETSSLKNQLLESRALQHYPVYAEKNRRFSTISEKQVLCILRDVAKGMEYLASHNISHGSLCARNVMMVDKMTPKITGFGLLDFYTELYIPDYRRFHSLETARSKVMTTRSDAWSFGILMWEVLTLGGTPFSDVRTVDVNGKIIRGLRLSQPQYVDDELYQLMLLCWQHDPEERPSFGDLKNTLHAFSEDDVSPHVLFATYESFQYEQYLPNLEFHEEDL